MVNEVGIVVEGGESILLAFKEGGKSEGDDCSNMEGSFNIVQECGDWVYVIIRVEGEMVGVGVTEGFYLLSSEGGRDMHWGRWFLYQSSSGIYVFLVQAQRYSVPVSRGGVP